jgi:hypothetical protein
MLKIGEVVKRKDNGQRYVITSMPWTVGECELVKLAPIPEDGLYLWDDVSGGVKTEILERG